MAEVGEARAGARRGEYGIDAPAVPASMGGVGVLLLVLGFVLLSTRPVGAVLGWTIWAFAVGGYLILSASSYLYTTRRGTFRVWAGLLDGLDLRGDERLLDLGCGRGAVLLLAAQRLPNGHAVGVDLWRSVDQSGNTEAATRANAEAEGVSARVELCTGDMTELPFDDGAFDVVVSSLAIHNIPSTPARARAVAEALRVVRPGGRILLADIRNARTYARVLRGAGATGVRCRRLGPRFWYGGPWVATTLVTARRAG
ncbi:class I SAM-dependent methyltransferase [Pseudonocardia ailaonensis]|uniref:Class I SAM-dependent methyltransferase n=1 Tax=Pseudonocardia ailaonensis TaxID=367279 RepID=A0ABN2NCG7_9PSEU